MTTLYDHGGDSSLSFLMAGLRLRMYLGYFFSFIGRYGHPQHRYGQYRMKGFGRALSLVAAMTVYTPGS